MAAVLQSSQIFVAAAASRVNRNNATLRLAVSFVEGRGHPGMTIPYSATGYVGHLAVEADQ